MVKGHLVIGHFFQQVHFLQCLQSHHVSDVPRWQDQIGKLDVLNVGEADATFALQALTTQVTLPAPTIWGAIHRGVQLGVGHIPDLLTLHLLSYLVETYLYLSQVIYLIST